MWHEREMPARWYDLLRERMEVEQLRMRIVKGGYLIKDYELQEVLTEAHRLDAEMLVVMRQTIAEAWCARIHAHRPHDARTIAVNIAKLPELCAQGAE